MSKKRRKSQKKPSPDTGLARENFPGLNATFYRMNPHGYLRRRLTNLLLWLGRGEDLEDLLRQGLEYDGMKMKWSEDEDEDLRLEEEKELQRFAIIEAEVLLHHVSETLLRFYVAHSPDSDCPWLDLSRTTSFATFKKEISGLRERLQSDSERDRLAFAFFGATDRHQWKPVPEEAQWDAGLKNLARFLDFFASVFLAPAPYNAAKHGLALMGGESGFALGAGKDEDPFLSRSGPALQYLIVKKEQGSGLPRWAEETKWVVLMRNLLMTWMGCDLLKALMKVGKARYTGELPDSMRLFDKPEFDELMKKTEPDQKEGIPGVVIEEMAMQLAYYARRK